MMWQWWQITKAKNQDVYDAGAVNLIGNLTPDWVVFDKKDDYEDDYNNDYEDDYGDDFDDDYGDGYDDD